MHACSIKGTPSYSGAIAADSSFTAVTVASYRMSTEDDTPHRPMPLSPIDTPNTFFHKSTASAAAATSKNA